MKNCCFCGYELLDEHEFCGRCGMRQEMGKMSDAEAATPSVRSKKGKTKRVLSIIAVVLAVLLLVTGIGFLTNWFGLVSPIQGLIDATTNTLTSKSMTVKMHLTTTDERGRTITDKIEIRLIFDRKKEEFAYVMESEGEIRAYYDGTWYELTNTSAGMGRGSGGDDVFDQVERYVDEDLNINWKNVIMDTRVSSYVDYTEAEDFLEDFYKENLRSKKWLKSALGYKKSGNVYTFEPDLGDFSDEIVDICADSEAFSEAAVDAVKDSLESFAQAAAKNDGSIKVSFTTKDGKLSEVKLVTKTENERTTVTLNFSDYNKTKITKAEIEELETTIENRMLSWS